MICIMFELIEEHAKDLIARTLDKDPNTRIKIDELAEHPFLRGHRQRSMSDAQLEGASR